MINKVEISKNPQGKETGFLIEEDGVTRSVPFDPRNRHCAEIMRLAEDNPKVVTFDFTSLRAEAEKLKDKARVNK